MTKNLRRWSVVAAFVAVSLVSLVLRLYRLNGPLADWHSWRQSDTAAVARIYLDRGIDLLHPQYYDLSNIQSGFDNPNGWRMVEMPLYQAAAVLLTRTVPAVGIEVSLRLLSVVASVASGLLLGLIVSRRVGKWAGVATSAVYAVLPYSMYYGRTILPDGIMVFWSVAAIYFADLAVAGKNTSWKWILMSSLAAAVALLTKPVAAFLLLPVAGMVILEVADIRKKVLFCLLYAAVALPPLFVWRNWIARFPEGIPVYMWLFNKDNVRFKGAFFQWLFSNRLGDLILGNWGLIPFGIGLAGVDTRRTVPFRLLLLGTLAYLVVMAGGNVQHDYYQILTIPVVAVYGGMGIAVLIGGKSGFGKIAGIGLAGVSVVFACMFSWYTIRGYYWINHPEIVAAGSAADRLLPKDAKVIAPYGGDTTFLYQTKRQGWPIGFEIDKKIKMGAAAYVSVAPQATDGELIDLASRYHVMERTSSYIIIDLTKPEATKTAALK